MRNSLILLFTGLLLASCHNDSAIPKGVMDKDKMGKVMWDVLQAQSLAQELSLKDTSLSTVTENKRLTAAVFKMYNITQKQYENSYEWYSKHPEVFGPVLDSLYAGKIKIGEEGEEEKSPVSRRIHRKGELKKITDNEDSAK